ncbi:MAG: Smr/MutS family protein [Bacteroidota bacterium]
MPKLDDTGQRISLDLHGMRVDDAIRLVRRTVQMAHQRGRAQVDVITGASTTRNDPQADTIKTRLTTLLQSGQLDYWIAHHRWSVDGGHCQLVLPITQLSPRGGKRITLRDVYRR